MTITATTEVAKTNTKSGKNVAAKAFSAVNAAAMALNRAVLDGRPLVERLSALERRAEPGMPDRERAWATQFAAVGCLLG